jgi:hypothetical protein
MPTRLTEIVVDTPDPVPLGRWWAAALGWVVATESAAESSVVPPPGHPGIELVFGGGEDDVKAGKNRVHLDLAPTDVARLEALGARRADVGQGAEVPWVVLADPEGNEFCVLEPRDEYTGTGAVAAIVCDALDPAALGSFWAAASGWPVGRSAPGLSGLRAPSGTGPWLEFVRTGEPHRYKNRWHLDVAGYARDDQATEVSRLLTLGATHIDIGQHADPDVTWVVLADPEQNEFCVLRSHT